MDSLLGYLIDTAPKGVQSSATVTLAMPCTCNVSIEMAVENATIPLNSSASFTISVACSGANTSCLEFLKTHDAALELRVHNITPLLWTC